MSLKQLLVPLTGADTDAAALATAFTVARPFDAHVEALFVRVDPRDAVPLLGEGMSGVLVEEIMSAAERESAGRAARARELFDEALSRASVPITRAPPGPGTVSACLVDAVGRVDETVARATRVADLVIFAHGVVAEDSQAYLTLENALLAGGRPVLLAPGVRPEQVGSSVAVAWNGGMESARAVAGAMPFLRRAETVHILTVETSVTEGRAGESLARYLAWHDIDARVQRLQAKGEPVGATILDRATALEADLLVMGGYGHSRVREMILGGVTRYVLGHTDLPILMAH